MMKLRMKLVAAVLCLLAVMSFAQAATPSAVGDDLRLLRITPAGEDVETGSQIVLAFDRAVVPLGRMERTAEEVPVTITPVIACEWRWIDPQALACQLGAGDALRDATRYTITVRPEFVSEKGEKLRRGLTQSFVTQHVAALLERRDLGSARPAGAAPAFQSAGVGGVGGGKPACWRRGSHRVARYA